MKKSFIHSMAVIIMTILSCQTLLAQENASFGFNQEKIKGIRNAAFGYRALISNTTGFSNTATGSYSLHSNTIGVSNTTSGYKTLFSNINGTGNTAIGEQTMLNNIGGNYNSAIGFRVLEFNTSGNYNVGTGTYALVANTTGNENSATGLYALAKNTTGNNNTAMGDRALLSNSTGSNNTALGYKADVGREDLTNAAAIGASAIVNTNNKIRIGSTTVTSVEGPVVYTVSDGRFKTNVKEEVKGLEFINQLRPVVYNFDTRKFEEFLTKNMSDSTSRQYMDKDFGPSTAIRQSGFIAQEVEEAAQNAKYNFNGVRTPENDNDNYSLSYAQFVVPLVKGMQEQQEMIEQLKKTNAEQQKQIDELKALVKKTTGQAITNTSLNNTNTLNQNVPNPFNGSTSIKYTTSPDVNKAEIAVFDASGKLVKRVPIAKGSGIINISTSDLTAGLYSYTLFVDGKTAATKTLVKE